MKLKVLYSFLQSDLDKIEQELKQTISTEHPVLKEASLGLLEAGGKRLRPVLVLLGGKFGDYDIEVMKKVAVTLELIHMASLVHDDVIDDAELRRGRPTVKSKWDNRIAMYTGDYIFARSLEIMTELDNTAAHQILSNAIVELCLGEIEQIKDQYNWDQNVRTYFRRIKRKTALLIAVSCQLGAVAANVPPSIHKKLFLFGYYIGMSFQITDDILDFTSTEEQLGKPAGSDLLQGNITLPVLYALQDAKLKDKIREISNNSIKEELEEIIPLIRQSGGIEYSLAISDRYLEKAMDILTELPTNRAKTAFYNIAKYIGKRKF